MSASTTSTLASTSSPGSSSSGAALPPSKSNSQILGLGISLGLVAFFLLAFILVFTLRHHRKRAKGEGWRGLSRGATLVEPRHIASRITPFGTRDARQPGRDMRVAHRRSNGIWEFSETPLNPSDAGHRNPAHVPQAQTKSSNLKSRKMSEHGYFDVEALAVPPPAYCAEDTYLKQ